MVPVNISINFVNDLGDNILGGAILNKVYDLSSNTELNYEDIDSTYILGQVLPSEGVVDLSLRYIDGLKNKLYSDGNDGLYYTLVHEMGHIFGILGIPLKLGALKYIGDDMSNAFYQISDTEYGGSSAVREYNNVFNDDTNNKWRLIPVENEGGGGTQYFHPEEGKEGSVSANNRVIDGISYPGLDKELMTGWLDDDDSHTFIPALSKITVGFLEDIGYSVNYDNADEYLASDQNI